jgi:uncharacterized protein YacL
MMLYKVTFENQIPLSSSMPWISWANMERAEMSARSMMRRIIGTIIVLAAFLVGSLITVGFYTTDYTLFQKIVVVLVALIIATTAISVMWVTWAGRRGWIPGKWQS